MLLITATAFVVILSIALILGLAFTLMGALMAIGTFTLEKVYDFLHNHRWGQCSGEDVE